MTMSKNFRKCFLLVSIGYKLMLYSMSFTRNSMPVARRILMIQVISIHNLGRNGAMPITGFVKHK